MKSLLHQRTILFDKLALLKMFLSFFFLALSGLLAYSNNNGDKDSELFTLGEVQVPGEIKITNIPEPINIENPIIIFLESQLSSLTARKKRALFKLPTSDFSLKVEYEYKQTSGTIKNETLSLSTDDPLTLLSIENLHLPAAHYVRLPIVSLPNLDPSYPVIIKFLETGVDGYFFDSALSARNLESSPFMAIWLPVGMFLIGILLAFECVAKMIIGFFHRDLLPEHKSYSAAVILSLCFGFLGFDRFYLGYKLKGAFKALTLGCLGIWYFYDLFMISSGKLKTNDGTILLEKNSTISRL